MIDRRNFLVGLITTPIAVQMEPVYKVTVTLVSHKEHLIRATLWSDKIREILLEEFLDRALEIARRQEDVV